MGTFRKKQHIYNRQQPPGPLPPAFASRIFALWHSHSPFLWPLFSSPRPLAPGSLNRRQSLCLQGVSAFCLLILLPIFNGRMALGRANRPMAPGIAWDKGPGRFQARKKGPKVWFSHTLGPYF